MPKGHLRERVLDACHPNGCTNTELCHRLNAQGNIISSLTNRLWKAGLLSRVRDEQDRGELPNAWVYRTVKGNE